MLKLDYSKVCNWQPHTYTYTVRWPSNEAAWSILFEIAFIGQDEFLAHLIAWCLMVCTRIVRDGNTLHSIHDAYLHTTIRRNARTTILHARMWSVADRKFNLVVIFALHSFHRPFTLFGANYMCFLFSNWLHGFFFLLQFQSCGMQEPPLAFSAMPDEIS